MLLHSIIEALIFYAKYIIYYSSVNDPIDCNKCHLLVSIEDEVLNTVISTFVVGLQTAGI